MYLIGYDNNSLTVTYLGHATQLLGRPHPSSRIVWVTKEEEFAAFHIVLETLEVYLILSVYKIESILAQRTTEVLRHVEIGMIYRWLYQDGIAWLSEAVDNEGNAWHDAWHKVDPLGLHLPAVSALLPCHDRRCPLWATHGVTYDLMLESAAQRINNEGRCGKVHIGHPQREQVFAPPDVRDGVNLQGVGALAIDDLVEVILHSINQCRMWYISSRNNPLSVALAP